MPRPSLVADEWVVAPEQPMDMNNGSRYRVHASILSSRAYLLLHYHYLTKITHGVSHRFFFSTAIVQARKIGSAAPREDDKPPMSIFSRLKWHRPKNALAGSGWRFNLGGSIAGKTVTERTAMQMTAVYACVRILAESIAGLPLHLYRYKDQGKEKALDHPLYTLLHDEPNPEMTSFAFREALMCHLLLWGNGYAQIIRNGKGQVTALYPLLPNRMTVDRDERGQLYYRYQRGSDETAGGKAAQSETVILLPSDVLHIPGLGFDGLVGYSPIAMSKNAIGLAMAAEEYGSKFFANGAAPSGVLETPTLIKDITKLRDSWNEAYGGSNNAHKVAVLEQGVTFKPISMSPQDSQLLETRKYQLDEIARIFRIPPHMIGDLEKSSFNNIENMSREFVTYTLGPWMARWEQSLARALLFPTEKGKMFIRFNVDGLLRGDYKSRMEGYAIGRQNGWMSANDIRELENLDLIPTDAGGDLYLVNGNMMPLEMAGAAYNRSAAPSLSSSTDLLPTSTKQTTSRPTCCLPAIRKDDV